MLPRTAFVLVTFGLAYFMYNPAERGVPLAAPNDAPSVFYRHLLQDTASDMTVKEDMT